MFTQMQIARLAGSVFARPQIQGAGLEALENRCLLSVAAILPANGASIQFDLTPAVVQASLNHLAQADNLPTPTATQTVFLHNIDGVESYTVDLASTGAKTALTVDANGSAVTAATKSRTTWGVLDGTGAGSNAAAAAGILRLVTADNLSAPVDSTMIHVVTFSDGRSIYSIKLGMARNPSSSHSHSTHSHETTIFVDSNGNPAGNQVVPFSALLPAVQTGLIKAAPVGAGLTVNSTQSVFVRTFDGTVTYTMVFRATGTVTEITVDDTGALVSRPGRSTTMFSMIPIAAKTELETLAVDDGDSSLIPAVQNVTAFSESNGVTVYRLSLTNGSGENFTISVDENGNPTVPPQDDTDHDIFRHHHGHGRGLDIGLSLGLGFGPGGKFTVLDVD